MLGEDGTGFEADLEVIHAKISRIRVGHVDGDQGNVSLFEDVRHTGRHMFLHLELDRQVHALGDKFLGVLNGNVGVVAVIEHEQFDAGCGGGRGYALG